MGPLSLLHFPGQHPPAVLPLSGRQDPSIPARTHPGVHGGSTVGPSRAEQSSVISWVATAPGTPTHPGCSSRSHRALLAQASRLRPRACCSSCEVLLLREPTPRALSTSLSFHLFGRLLAGRVSPVLVGPYTTSSSFLSSHLTRPNLPSPPTRRPSFVDDRPFPLLPDLGHAVSSCFAKSRLCAVAHPTLLFTLQACKDPWLLILGPLKVCPGG